MPPFSPSPETAEAPAAVVAAPPAQGEGAAEATREAIRIAVEQAISSALAWQRETEWRIARAERDLSELRAPSAAHARSTAELRGAREIPAARPPEIPRAAVGAPPLRMQPATPHVAMVAHVSMRPSLSSIEDAPFDIAMLPDELNGGRRKRAIAWVALMLILLGLGTLVVMAIASQAKHGL